jgi:hypothetical protein
LRVRQLKNQFIFSSIIPTIRVGGLPGSGPVQLEGSSNSSRDNSVEDSDHHLSRATPASVQSLPIIAERESNSYFSPNHIQAKRVQSSQNRESNAVPVYLQTYSTGGIDASLSALKLCRIDNTGQVNT